MFFKKSFLPGLFLTLILALSLDCAAAKHFPNPEGYVSDFAGVIDGSTRSGISSVIRELEEKTSCEIAVVTLKSIGNDTIEQVAVDLFKEWGIGKKNKDNGVLLITSLKERKIRIEAGYGLEGILPDGKCGEIIDNFILPEFRKGGYSKGLASGTYAIASIIAENANVKLNEIPAEEQNQAHRLGIPSIFKLIIFIVLIIVFIRHPILFLLFFGGRGGGSGGGFGGGFGGFGGGGSGGDGASRGW